MVMVINTTAYETLEATFSGNAATIQWMPYIAVTTSDGVAYVSDTTAATATYPLTSAQFNWGAPNVQNSRMIAVTALRDDVTIYIGATGSSGSVISSYFLNPFALSSIITYTSETSAYLSCVYVQVSTLSSKQVDTGNIISWGTVNTGDYVIYGGLSGNENAYDISVVNSIIGHAPSAAKVTYTIPSVSILDAQIFAAPEVINDKYALSDLPITRSTPYNEILFNPTIGILISATDTTYVILCAIQNNNTILPFKQILWYTDDTTNTAGLTGTGLNQLYTFSTQGSGAQLGVIMVSAKDLSKNYTYYLSSYQGAVSGQFRPYETITSSSTLTANTQKLPNDKNTYHHYIKGLGVTSNVLHNIAPNQYILWECDNSNVVAYRSNLSTPYVFGSIATAPNIDELYIDFTTSIVTTTPKICSVSFQICALSSSRVEDGVYAQHQFTVQFPERVSETYFGPKFRFQYEDESVDTIYRPVTASAYYNISNTSVLPPSSFGAIQFTFDNAVCAMNFDTRTSNIPSGVTHLFNAGTPRVCSITMSVCASAAGYAEYFSLEAMPKTINFATIPAASGFVGYPEFTWNGSAWQRVVTSYGTNQGVVNTPAAVLSAYGLCHTENFFLSSNVVGANEYEWSIQPIDGSLPSRSTISTTPTAWVPVKTTQNSSFMSICANVFTAALPRGMPSRYYDSPSGAQFINFSSTFDSVTSQQRKHIDIIGVSALGLEPNLNAVNYTQHPSPNNMSITGSYAPFTTASPFNISVPAFYFYLSSEFWNEAERGSILGSRTSIKTVGISVDEIGDTFLGVPKNETTVIRITPGLQYTLQLKQAHPSASDWCLENTVVSSDSNSMLVTAYPITPIIYNPNRHVVTGENVVFENLVQCFPGVSSLTWADRGAAFDTSICTPYITSFSAAGDYDITLSTKYFLGPTENTIQNTFSNIVNVQTEYTQFDSDISRVFGITRLVFPHDKADVFMAPNEWVVADTFNACIIKLHNNLQYLQNMSKLYDVPPTEYIGWYGTLYYNNSAKRTRWFTNTPLNSYAYDRPDYAIDHSFNRLQSCFIKDDILYVSNGTSVSILSSNLFGDVISRRDYKTIGDDFTNVRSVEVDSDNRIYLLDSHDETFTGSKNRVLVFSYNFALDQWQLLYEWGGLGGPNAKSKFNNPNDLYLDQNNVVWVADTDNQRVKKYTRTGSWLGTIESEYFTDTEKPMSVTSDDDLNLYVLTNSQVVKFDSSDMFVEKFDIPGGALKIQKARDGGFVYVTYSDRVVKFLVSGVPAGTIAQNDFSLYVKDYRDTFHDSHRNLYIVNKNHILKYVDKLYIVSLALDVSSKLWPLEKLLVQKDEYVQDWVINRCLHRMWDNIELVRQSLIGKFGYETFRTVTTAISLSARAPDDDFDYCNYDWLYDYGVRIPQEIVYEYEKPVVRTFKPAEYKMLPCQKSTLYVGINEFSSAEVYNRCFGCLYDNLETVRIMIADP
jgi:hypothetical protein